MKKILVVDDEEKIRKMYADLLKDEGYEVVCAQDVDYANEILKRQNIDLVLLDIRMPVAEGDILYEIIQLFHRKTKVIVTSVYPPEEQRKMIPQAAGYYDKSQDLKILLSTIKKVLSDGQAEAGEY